MVGEELPQLGGGEVGPVVTTVADGDQRYAAMTGAGGGRRSDLAVGRLGRLLTLIDLAPQRIQLPYRWAVDMRESAALAAAVGNHRIRGAVNRHDRQWMWRPARVQLCPGHRSDRGEQRGVTRQRARHHGAVTHAGGTHSTGV